MPRPADPSRRRRALMLALAAGIALPALAQQTPESILPPGFGDPAPAPQAAPAQPQTAPAAGEQPSRVVTSGATVAEAVRDAIAEVTQADQPRAAPQPEYPAGAGRPWSEAGLFEPASLGLGARPWGTADGDFLSTLLRRMDTPIASRWAQIALRSALLAKGDAPANVHPADWAAERAWLLLRLGEADAARLLVAQVDTDKFTPKMVQVAAQAALATGDPSGLCAIDDKLGSVEPKVAPLVAAICASLSGEAERAAADIESARRRGRLGGIDLALADKIVGAGADTARAVTIEWEPVDRLNVWRFGLATASGMMPPARLIDASTPQLRAWLARSPIFAAPQKMSAARTAAGLGVFSSSAYVDLQSSAYDVTDPDDLSQSDAWRLRQAYVGKDDAARVAAMRSLWSGAKGEIDTLGAHVLTAKAASRIAPSKDLQADAPDLIASMLAGGFDREAARWAGAVQRMDDAQADQCWALLALGAPDGVAIDASYGRIDSFAGRDDSKGHHRTALLVAGLAGLGRIDARTAGRLNQRYGLGLGRATAWTGLIDGAARGRQAGTALVLAASGLQAPSAKAISALYLFHGVNAVRQVGLGYAARMIAAEALARA